MTGIMYAIRVAVLVTACIVLGSGNLTAAGALALCWAGLVVEDFLMLSRKVKRG